MGVLAAHFVPALHGIAQCPMDASANVPGGDPFAASRTSFVATQTLSCNATGEDVRFRGGQTARVICPTHCQLDPAAVAVGATVHPLRSSVCVSAIVDGLLPEYGRLASGGQLFVTKINGLSSYTGKDVEITAALPATGVRGPAYHMYAEDTIDLPKELPWEMPAGCSTTFADVKLGRPGASASVLCHGECLGEGSLEGSGVHTAGSSVCRAAVFEGVIGSDGGSVMVTRGHGQDAFFGSKKRGDVSQDAPKSDESYTVSMPTAEVLARTKNSPEWNSFL